MPTYDWKLKSNGTEIRIQLNDQDQVILVNVNSPYSIYDMQETLECIKKLTKLLKMNDYSSIRGDVVL